MLLFNPSTRYVLYDLTYRFASSAGQDCWSAAQAHTNWPKPFKCQSKKAFEGTTSESHVSRVHVACTLTFKSCGREFASAETMLQDN